MADFFYHVIPTTKSQVVHFSNSRNPDIVVFGTDIQVQPRSFIYAGKEIIVRPIKEGHLQVSRFSPGQADRFTTCTTELGDLLTAIVRVGGGYGETLECLHAANEGGAINARVLVGARPRPGRSYFRDQQLDEESQVEEPETLFQMANPIPDLFNNRLLQGRDPLPAGPDEDADGSSPSVTAEPEENFFSRFKKTLSW